MATQVAVAKEKLLRMAQEDAEAMGGTEARIIVDKRSAKKIILKLFESSLIPMNITQIFKVSM
jgi:predicted anti-sigma-YlaC factor YlaD